MKSVTVVLLLTIFNVEAWQDLCGVKSKSCTSQLWINSGGPTDMCYMSYYKLDTTECASLNFQYKNDATNVIGDVQLQAYVTEEYMQTLFNVLFRNIHWKKVHMRFSRIGFENEKNMCGTFRIWENTTVPNTSVLKYDCPWSYKSYEGQNFIFEYELSWLSVLYKKFMFKVPSFDNFRTGTEIKALEIFSYIDITDVDNLKLHIQTAAPKYNVTHYLVEVMRERNDTITRLTVQVLDAKEAVNGELTYVYSIWNEFGSIYFTVSPINNICKEDECFKSTTPKYLVGRKKSSLVIGMVGASVIIFALFYGLIFWNKKERHYELAPVKLMLVYNPSTIAHCEVVRNLARVLQGAFCLTIFMDSVDANHQDPTFWCNQSFTSASHIVYIASPDVSPTTSIPENCKSICSTHDIALKLMKKELRCPHPTKQIIVLTFPYSANSIPSELSEIRRFSLMKDFDEFSRYVKPPTPFVPTTLIIWSAQHLEMYMDLTNSVYLAEKEAENSNLNNCTPRITITENVALLIADDDSSEDGRTERVYNHKISDVLSSGGADEEEYEARSNNFNGYKHCIQDIIK